jgi:hypothetical protein
MRSDRKNTRRPKPPADIIFGAGNDTPRQKEIRFFILSLLIGVVFCALFGCALFFLNKQGRI